MNGTATLAGVSRAGLADVHARIAPRSRRREMRERAGRYLQGLLVASARAAGNWPRRWGRAGPQDMQRLLDAADWDAKAVRDDLRAYRAYVVEHLADKSSGVLVIDETGFLKKGIKSAGGVLHYSGTGRTAREPADRGLPALRFCPGRGLH